MSATEVPATTPATRVDPITASVIAGALDSIAIEMGHKLARMSYSSIIRESEDFGTVICDGQGRQLCESPQSTPLQSGPIPGYVRGINRRFAELGDEWRPGDVVMHNNAYYGSSHGPDVGFLVPIFWDGELVGFSGTTAHHLDVGALTPGSCGIVDATDAYAEGLQFTAIKVEEEGRRNEMVWRIVRDNIRMSQIVVADMEAQIAAARIGHDRFVELIERYGLQTVQGACEDLMDYSERVFRQEIAKLPDGTYTAETRMDGYLDHPDPAYRDLPIVATVTVAGSDITIDLTGTAPQVDLPINLPFEGTVDIAIYLVLRSILLDSETHEPVPSNSGLFRPITITAPAGCLANPIYPAPTIARFVGGNLIAETVMRALAPLVPDKVAASVGNLKVIASSGLRDGGHWVHMDIIEGSYGGRLGKDGLDAVDTLYGNTRNNPIEDIESHLPLRVVRYELNDDTGGPGRWRGGIGSIRDTMFTEDGGFSIEGDGNKWPPPGIFGGQEGTPGAIILNPDTDREESLPSKIPYRKVKAGDVVRKVCPSAGGYGPVEERDPARVREDVLDGFVTRESAKAVYGVDVDA
ncbi:MAG: hydantoinase B/oxoprolinase family protein [Thermoleophilia bacterium]